MAKSKDPDAKDVELLSISILSGFLQSIAAHISPLLRDNFKNSSTHCNSCERLNINS